MTSHSSDVDIVAVLPHSTHQDVPIHDGDHRSNGNGIRSNGVDANTSLDNTNVQCSYDFLKNVHTALQIQNRRHLGRMDDTVEHVREGL